MFKMSSGRFLLHRFLYVDIETHKISPRIMAQTLRRYIYSKSVTASEQKSLTPRVISEIILFEHFSVIILFYKEKNPILFLKCSEQCSVCIMLCFQVFKYAQYVRGSSETSIYTTFVNEF